MNMGNSMQTTIKNDIDMTITTGENDKKCREQIEQDVKDHIENNVNCSTDMEQVQQDNNNIEKWLGYCNSW